MIPSYLKPVIEKENLKHKKERDDYEDALQHIEITLHNGIDIVKHDTM